VETTGCNQAKDAGYQTYFNPERLKRGDGLRARFKMKRRRNTIGCLLRKRGAAVRSRRGTLLSLGTSLAVITSVTFPASSYPAVRGSITVRCTETLKRSSPSSHAPSGTGHFTISGAIIDKGTVTDYRTQKGNTAVVRRVAVGKTGTITFVITINLSTGAEPWTIASGTKAYRGLHGNGKQVLDAWYDTPAKFVMKGAVSH
jgi:hypothetical protein